METPTNKPVLKASEVGQFAYCSVAWHLERQGYKPKSSALGKSLEEQVELGIKIEPPELPILERGLEEHADLGAKIESLSKAERTSKQLSYVGYALVLVAVIVFIWWLLC